MLKICLFIKKLLVKNTKFEKNAEVTQIYTHRIKKHFKGVHPPSYTNITYGNVWSVYAM